MLPYWGGRGAGIRLGLGPGRATTSADRVGRQEDLGAVGAPGAPSAVGWPFDPEPVVDLGVVAFAEQRGIVQVGFAARDPVHLVVHVAPVGGGVAAGEYAVPIPVVHRPAQLGWADPLVAAVVQQLPVGAEHDAGD